MERYRLIEPLGTGGMSEVWRAFDEVLGRPVAVKLLAPKLLADPRSRQRIQAEARAAALLSHPHIATVHDFGHTVDGAPFVVMELVTGRSLEDRLADGPLPPAEALRLGAQLASALAAVHARGLVHRDVKPANVMLTGDGAKLVDFGISAVAGDTTDVHEVLGTPAYLAPERLRGLRTTAATDVYSLGLVLYRALTGRLPWPGETTTEVLHAHRLVRPAPLPPDAGVPRAVAAAVLRCLAKAPENRPTAAEMLVALRAAAAAEPAPRRRMQLIGLPMPTRAVRLGPAAAAPPSATATPSATAPPSAAVPSPATVPAVAAVKRLGSVGRGRLAVAGAAALAVGGLAGLAAWQPSRAEGGMSWQPAGASPTAPTAQAAAPGGCLVRYSVRNHGDGTFTADLSLANTGAAAVPSWTLVFQVPAGQAIGSAGDVEWEQDGTSVRLTGASEISAGTERGLSLTGSYRDPQGLPTGFALNDTACREILFAPVVATTPADSGGGSGGGPGSDSGKGPGKAKPPAKPRPKD